MAYSIPCKKCGELFTKASNRSHETRCGDCIYKDIFTKSRNSRAAVANDELSKKDILKKLNRIEKKLDNFDDNLTSLVHSQVTDATADILKEVANKAALEHSQEFIDLKTDIENSQSEHEARMKTLLATVNTRAIATENKLNDEMAILHKRVTELRRIANSKGWKISLTKTAEGTKVKD